MELLTRGRAGDIQLANPALFKFHRYILILAHARSYTTLLGHILGSHRQICGYAEAMVRYDTAVDLIRLNCEVYKAGNYRGDCDYVLDKILYDALTVADVVMTNPRVTPILMIREPVPTIVSQVRYRISEHERGIANWGNYGTDRVAHTELAAMYYIQRLHTLRALCAHLETLGKRGIFLSAEGLMADTPAAFRLLERELGLEEPLDEEYRLFPRTGEAGSGDTSTTIRSGRIVRGRDEPVEKPLPIPEPLLQHARDAYERCLAAMLASPMLVRVGE